MGPSQPLRLWELKGSMSPRANLLVWLRINERGWLHRVPKVATKPWSPRRLRAYPKTLFD
jgi:arylamine N-acetyltransferase